MTISNDDIETAAGRPEQMRGDEGMVKERSMKDLIEAAKFTQQQSAPTVSPFGMRVAKTMPPGTVYGHND